MCFSGGSAAVSVGLDRCRAAAICPGVGVGVPKRGVGSLLMVFCGVRGVRGVVTSRASSLSVPASG